ncbi:ATP phosphoribosyltransferase regulatory subunit [Sulfitobacter sp. HNIBRBA2951]|uniref:ATP phosphoribosyltransferase regulatory subunit n=1 Tax=Sulfitobacter aquimarinus TaxID=3158557 RepID=UPI0032DEF1FE
MPTRLQTNAKAAALRAVFEANGAIAVEPPILQPADTLLDLYGEDIRARAYVTSDALRGEQMLRPDFTVPVVQMHMAEGADPARYTYAGEVFRRQENDPERANEYVQVGFEIFDRADPAASDAEVFALIADALSGLNVRATTGDIGLLMAAVDGLDTSVIRKAALMRHIWRPRRFRQLLDQYAGNTPVSEARQALLSSGPPVLSAPLVGARRQHEIDARLAALRADADVAPLAAGDVALIDALLDVSAPMPQAIALLQDLSEKMPAIGPAVARLEARQSALSALGIDTSTLVFEANYGRTSMEYYDGFVFGFRASGRTDLPPLATGGRYDALTRRLGGGREIPAVGGVMRPGVMLDLEAAT